MGQRTLTLMAAALLACALPAKATVMPPALDPSTLPATGTVHPRFQSYNIEMVEVTGGRFWKPYRLGPPASPEDRYAYRPPLDLANPRLVRLAAALGPAIVRVSGTWANRTWFQAQPGTTRPPGFDQTLTMAQLAGLARFLRATDGELLLSFAGVPRLPDGRWDPAQMQALVAASRRAGIRLIAGHYLNEPNLVHLTGTPKGYSANEFARDSDLFATAFRRAAPGALVLAPDAVGQGPAIEALARAANQPVLGVEAMMAPMRVTVDAVAYHHYGGVSERCATSGPLALTAASAFDPAFLARTDATAAYYAALRDRFAPGAPLWLTEVAQAACGGSRWAATFADTPRYIDQMGRLARAGVQVILHNTLAASDYALLDERDFAPRPNYWAALLWARLMDRRVLTTDHPSPTLRLYAHCLKGRRGGVALVAVNLEAEPRTIALAQRAEIYALADADTGRAVTLNGTRLALGPRDALPALNAVGADALTVAPRGVSFAVVPDAGNRACR